LEGVISTSSISQPDPAIGTWKLNLGESVFALAPAPKSNIIKIEACDGHGLKVSAETIDAAGTEFHPEAVYKFDGKDYPLTGSPVADTISVRRINDWKAESLWKKGGKVVLAAKIIISCDGKSMNIVTTGLDAQWRAADELLVYDRQ
jgi:hypothetical protein